MNAMERLIAAVEALECRDNGDGTATIVSCPHTIKEVLDALSAAKAMQVEVDLLFGPAHDETPSRAALDVLAERRRQVTEEAFAPEHDDQWINGELAMAACCYAWPGRRDRDPFPWPWPWAAKWWKPWGYRRNLVRAAALLLAEIERLDR